MYACMCKCVCERESSEEALVEMHRCAGSSEPWLHAYRIKRDYGKALAACIQDN